MSETNLATNEISRKSKEEKLEYIDNREIKINMFNNTYLNQINFLEDSYPAKKYYFTKRLIDFVGSFAGLILLLPIFILVSIFIKIETPRGKIFFSQERVGLDGKVFKMYKFRSMVSNAEEILNELKELNESSGAMFKMANDPRITKIGKFIRKTSIDELPQLWNVIRGDMSLVGPRPPLLSEVVMYTEYDLQRLSVIPGCTGLWQATLRNNVGFQEMVEIDLLYIKKRNLILDIKIMVMTFRGMLNGH